MGFRRPWLVLGLLVTELACNGRQEEAPVASPPAVFGEHRTSPASKATKELGEDCGQHGASECLTGLCLHTQAEPGRGYFCSSTCRGQGECPEDWVCTQLHPSEATRVCIPPEGWQSASVKPRGAAGAANRPVR
ncbi:hypothetical protein ACN28E_09935 [Archangium lansingense]|uniref:hypothetical protein n=1 Tax=Archangium lansingense TaxID=2995310 RepID=UPI003B828F38